MTQITRHIAHRRTYAHHMAYALLDALASGVLANGRIMAVIALGAEDWQLTLPLALSSLGMFASFATSQTMARQAKKPYIIMPGVMFALATLMMATTSTPLAFMIWMGIGSICEMIARPAIAAFIRQSYHAAERGHITGTIRGWCSILFLLGSMGSAAPLQLWPDQAQGIISAELVAAGVMILTSVGVFLRIRINEEAGWVEMTRHDAAGAARAWRILKNDRRFRTYLIGSFIFGLSGLTYVSLIPALLAKDLGYGYLTCAMLIHVTPSVVAFVTTPRLGRLCDRIGPLRSWAVIRLGWGLDPILLLFTPLLAMFSGALAMITVVIARAFRGAAMGGSYVLWWQVGVHYFAPPGADTTRYMGLIMLLTATARLSASLLAATLVVNMPRAWVIGLGGLGVLLSAMHAWWQAQHDERLTRLRNIHDYEQTFTDTVDSGACDINTP